MHSDAQVSMGPSENMIRLDPVTVPYFVGLPLIFIVIEWALGGWAHSPLWYSV